MAQIAYIRVSSVDQNEERQLADCGVQFDQTFIDKASGASKARPALQELLRYVRRGDCIHVHSIDRLARSLDDLRELVTTWNQEGIAVRFHKEGLTFTAEESNPMSELMLNMLGAVAQFERSMIRERQREGIAKAKARGVYQGKAKNESLHQQIIKLRKQGVSLRKIASELGCGVSTVQRALKVA